MRQTLYGIWSNKHMYIPTTSILNHLFRVYKQYWIIKLEMLQLINMITILPQNVAILEWLYWPECITHINIYPKIYKTTRINFLSTVPGTWKDPIISCIWTSSTNWRAGLTPNDALPSPSLIEQNVHYRPYNSRIYIVGVASLISFSWVNWEIRAIQVAKSQ